jgi:hypothetical protein
VPTLEALIAHDLGSKLVLLPGAHQLPGRIAALELPVLDVPGVFEREKLVMPTWGLVPSSVMSPPPTPTKAKTPPPASKPRSPISPSASAIRYLDPSIVRNYLTRCFVQADVPPSPAVIAKCVCCCGCVRAAD